MHCTLHITYESHGWNNYIIHEVKKISAVNHFEKNETFFLHNVYIDVVYIHCIYAMHVRFITEMYCNQGNWLKAGI